MNKPWWLWEGAAVRCIGFTYVATVEELWENGTMQVRSFEMGCESKEYPQDYLPIENPAITGAPDDATHVMIGDEVKHGGVSLTWARTISNATGSTTRYYKYRALWKGCPGHLKGQTWELPIKPAPGA